MKSSGHVLGCKHNFCYAATMDPPLKFPIAEIEWLVGVFREGDIYSSVEIDGMDKLVMELKALEELSPGDIEAIVKKYYHVV
jgi:hypothetical protein